MASLRREEPSIKGSLSSIIGSIGHVGPAPEATFATGVAGGPGDPVTASPPGARGADLAVAAGQPSNTGGEEGHFGHLFRQTTCRTMQIKLSGLKIPAISPFSPTLDAISLSTDPGNHNLLEG